MKKKIALTLLAVVLLLAGLGGGVYAVNPQGHAPVNKLVGVGLLGALFEPGTPDLYRQQQTSSFFFTNPDCVNKITITQVSIMRVDGSIVYQGPFITSWPGMPREIITRPMEPHETWFIILNNCMYKGTGDPTDDNSWLTMDEAMTQHLFSYTVEIAWKTTTRATTCPLIGWWTTQVTWFYPSGDYKDSSAYEGQMVNMIQGGR